MWTLTKSFRFEAAHHLPFHDGKCRGQHGHSWVLVVEVQGATLHTHGPQTGMVLDYGAISRQVQPLLTDVLDHKDLNVSTRLESPTSEALAEWVYRWLKPRLPELTAITIEETTTSSCRFVP